MEVGEHSEMKILFINKFYYLRGGAERSFFETKRVLQERGHQVIPFSMQDERNESTPYSKYFVNNVDFNRNHSLREKIGIIPRVIYFRQARRKLEQLLHREHVDVAHLFNIAHQISPSILDSLKKFGIPVVQKLCDYKLICPTYNMLANGEVCERCHDGNFYHAVLQRCNKGSLAASLLNAIEMYAHRGLGLYRRGIDLFISPSLFLRRKMIADGVDDVPIFHLPNFIETREYAPRYGGQDYCVYFGRLSPEKGVTTLIRAMRGIEKFRLLIVGEGLERETLEDLVRDEGLSNIEFVGYRQGDDLKEVVRDSLFVVVPSEWYENCPHTVLEAFALGKPVIGADIGGIPELISPEKDGLLFRPADVLDLRAKLLLLATDSEKATKMGINAREKVERKYGADQYFQRLMTAYKQAIGCQ
jgi:glycosyltransferase involved in cell wall biosynthesis